MDFEAILRLVEIAFAITVFGACLVRSNPKFRPVEGLGLGLGLIAFGAAIQFLLRPFPWLGLVPWLTMERGTISFGTTLLAMGYGFIAYSLVRVIWTPRRDGDG